MLSVKYKLNNVQRKLLLFMKELDHYLCVIICYDKHRVQEIKKLLL